MDSGGVLRHADRQQLNADLSLQHLVETETGRMRPRDSISLGCPRNRMIDLVDELGRDRLRREKGDRALLRAIENAKSKRLYGEPLIDFLERSFPMRPQRSA